MPPVDLPHLTDELPHPAWERLAAEGDGGHPPRILILYGSLRPQSFSRKLAYEAERILRHLGAETRVFDPSELPMLDSVSADHSKVQELRALSLWSEPHDRLVAISLWRSARAVVGQAAYARGNHRFAD